jgi:hypothetical protein
LSNPLPVVEETRPFGLQTPAPASGCRKITRRKTSIVSPRTRCRRIRCRRPIPCYLSPMRVLRWPDYLLRPNSTSARKGNELAMGRGVNWNKVRENWRIREIELNKITLFPIILLVRQVTNQLARCQQLPSLTGFISLNRVDKLVQAVCNLVNSLLSSVLGGIRTGLH